MRLVIADCLVDYAGKLTAHLAMSKRLIILKADGSVAIHADDRAYKPLNWMNPPCVMTVTETGLAEQGGQDSLFSDEPFSQIWTFRAATGDELVIKLGNVYLDVSDDLGIDPGLEKDGVEAHLQALLAENPDTFGSGWTTVQREYATPIGPVDLLCKNAEGQYIAVEVKRRGEIDGVEQLTRYLELLRREPRFSDIRGVFAAQLIKPQAKTLANDRGISCVTVDYDALRGMDHPENRLF